MYYGVQLAASGALTALYRTDVLANNLANADTAGFKPDFAYARQRDVVRVEDDLPFMPSNELLEKLGAGVHMAPNAVDHTQGTLSETGNPLDLAIRGDGFFVLRTLADSGTAGIRFSRDGRFTLDSSGRLVNATTGLPVMSDSNLPITLDRGLAVSVDTDGTVRQAGDAVARIQITDIKDRALLTRVGDGMFKMSNSALGQTIPATGTIQQGMIEGSAVNAINAMMGVQAAAKSVGTNFTMIAYQNRMMDRAINTFGRIA
ncbi:MAG: flagellar hook basal-body protein [Phycisphaeraceae bacterium]|nr:MAG: flagellar hook basal-body protein [Phycisphaeraceae bacterium]